MSDKRKLRARELAKKLGISYQSAINRLDAETIVALQPLLESMQAESTFAVLVRVQPLVATSPDPREVRAHLDELVKTHPNYIAESGAVQRGVSPAERQVLLRDGAANEEVEQMIRTHHVDRPFAFSDRCDACKRWIWCGMEERSDACACGRRYRVVFDLAKPRHWTQTRGQRCVDCGTEHTFTEPHENRNPWRYLNRWQPQCSRCAANAQKPTAREIHQWINSAPKVWFRSQPRLRPGEVQTEYEGILYNMDDLISLLEKLLDEVEVEGARAFYHRRRAFLEVRAQMGVLAKDGRLALDRTRLEKVESRFAALQALHQSAA